MIKMEVGIDDMQAKVFQEALNELARRGEDMTPLMTAVGGNLVDSTQERFERTSTAPDGTPWKPRYVPEGATPSDKRILVKDAHLSGSIDYEASQNSVSVGTNVFYAAVHQFGMTIKAKPGSTMRFNVGGQWLFAKSVTIPARPFIGISEDDGEMILGEATDWLAGAFHGAGGAP